MRRTSQNRRIRIFISSTFRDMVEERDALMIQTWPVLRRLCRERHVELVEVDLRWGITESQSTRMETLKLCLDEIHACRPFFIGLLGERYGWTPGDDAFTADLKEEQAWLKDFQGKSVTELEIIHGVLRNPDMAGRAFFYFRDPAYSKNRGPDFLSETKADADKQTALKTLIHSTCVAKQIPLRENYPDPMQLAAMVLADLTAAIKAQFPEEDIPDALTREAHDHEAFAEIRRRTYIGRADYFEALDRHAAGDGVPLLLLGDSGSGKSALLANWVAHWREIHHEDFIFQHYIGGTADSADHWRLMARLMSEIKRWSGDTAPLPAKHDEILKDFPLWLTKARARAEHERVRFILIIDALNQLNDQDHARLLAWLPEHPFNGPLRLIVSVLPGKPGADDLLEVIQRRRWSTLRVQPLTVEERWRMISDYLARFGKKLDENRLILLASSEPVANPLYLKILLDDLRITGTYEHLDERLKEYLSAADIPALLKQVLTRYQRDYERDRKGLVAETLGLIYAARRGLSETELLQLLRPTDKAQLPPALWTPLRAALEDSLVDRGGILNFAHDFFRMAVGSAFVPDKDKKIYFQLQLADWFEKQPITARTCDELPWLLCQAGARERLRACILNIDIFLEIQKRDQAELMSYWVWLGQDREMGKLYLASLNNWAHESDREEAFVSFISMPLSRLLVYAGLYADAEPLCRMALDVSERCYHPDHHITAGCLNNLVTVLTVTGRLMEAEPLMRRALAMGEKSYGPDHQEVAEGLDTLGQILQQTGRSEEAKPLFRRALSIIEMKYGPDHPAGADYLNSLAYAFMFTGRPAEAEPLFRRAWSIAERSYGPDHSGIAPSLINLCDFLARTGRPAEAIPLCSRAVALCERNFGPTHPWLAKSLFISALAFRADSRPAEAELLLRRALAINEKNHGPDHQQVAESLNNLGQVLRLTDRAAEAEPLLRRALAINEKNCGASAPDVAESIFLLARVLKAINKLPEAESLFQRAIRIFLDCSRTTGHQHQRLKPAVTFYASLLMGRGMKREEMLQALQMLGSEVPGIFLQGLRF